jgi:hypothetical protein
MGTLRKTSRKKIEPLATIVSFQFDNRTYQIDPKRQKVYRAFVEIETSKAFEIMSVWRSMHVQA